MTISHRTFKMVVIAAGVLAVALLPFWPYSSWGYFPSVVFAVGGAFLLMMRKLQTN